MTRSGILAIFLLAAALVAAFPPVPAFAQLLPPADVGARRVQMLPPPQRRGGFLERLFGPRLLQPRGRPILGQPPTRQLRPAEPPLPVVVVIPKDADAKKILVLGDFVAGGLAWGLEQTLAEEPKLAVVDRSNNASGLVRADFYDWNSELTNLLNEEKPDIIVIELGANDRQQMRIAKERLAPHSAAWEKIYGERIAGMVETLKVYGRPFFWVGAPPMRLSAASADMAYLNGLFKARVGGSGGHFIDIWNGFTNENGTYISSGPDVEGQLRALRSGDGINFTRAGRLKLAFYVDREIRRQTGIGAGGVDLLASTNQTSHIEIGPDGKKRLVGPVISLSDPLPGAGTVLAGGDEGPAAQEGETLQVKVIVKGEALPPVAGRADDFSWPPRPRAATLEAVTPAAAD